MEATKKTILILDDERLILNKTKAILSDLVDEVITSDDPNEALEIIKKRKLSCIISDIRMPQMSGIDFVRLVRDENHDVPFIIFTGFGNGESRMEFTKYNIYAFLEKPEMLDLSDMVKHGLDNNFSSENKAFNSRESFLEVFKKVTE